MYMYREWTVEIKWMSVIFDGKFPIWRCRKYPTLLYVSQATPDNKVHGANMGPNRGRQDPGGPHVGRMNFASWGYRIHMQPIW